MINIGPLKILTKRTGSDYYGLAWHWKKSITWRWIVHFTQGLRVFYLPHNNGGVARFGCLRFCWQRNMWRE